GGGLIGGGGAGRARACLNGWPARKRTTRRAGMAAAAPVLGLRPTGARLARTCHVPKQRRMTGSPCCKLALIVVRMASTAASALAVVDPSSWAIRCTISAFLIVRCSVFLVDVRRVGYQPSTLWTSPVCSSPGRRDIHTGTLREVS